MKSDFMRIKYGGPISPMDLIQALYQDRPTFERRGLLFMKNVYLYGTPCLEDGTPRQIIDESGKAVTDMIGSTAYRCAADAFEKREQCLEPRIVPRP